MSTRELTEAQRQTLTTGLTWLYQTEQPDDAVADPHGIQSPAVDGRTYRFIPAGHSGAPVVVATIDNPNYIRPPMQQELTTLALQIERLGFPFDSTWNSNAEQGSVGLMVAAHPSLLAAARRRCPDHLNPLCGWEGCPWLADGTAKLHRPESWF